MSSDKEKKKFPK